MKPLEVDLHGYTDFMAGYMDGRRDAKGGDFGASAMPAACLDPEIWYEWYQTGYNYGQGDVQTKE